jgi:hypothetical protein
MSLGAWRKRASAASAAAGKLKSEKKLWRRESAALSRCVGCTFCENPTLALKQKRRIGRARMVNLIAAGSK